MTTSLKARIKRLEATLVTEEVMPQDFDFHAFDNVRKYLLSPETIKEMIETARRLADEANIKREPMPSTLDHVSAKARKEWEDVEALTATVKTELADVILRAEREAMKLAEEDGGDEDWEITLADVWKDLSQATRNELKAIGKGRRRKR